MGATLKLPAGELLGKKEGFSDTLMVGLKISSLVSPPTPFNSSPAEPNPDHKKNFCHILYFSHI